MAAGKKNFSIGLWSFVSCSEESACFRWKPGRKAELRGRGGRPEDLWTPGPSSATLLAASQPCSLGFLVAGGQELPFVYSRFNLVCPLKCEMKLEFYVWSIMKRVLSSYWSAPLLGCTSAHQPRWQRCVSAGSLKSEEAFRCGVEKASWAEGVA